VSAGPVQHPFPAHLVRARTARLDGAITRSELDGSGTRLTHRLTVGGEPFELDGRSVEPTFDFPSIPLHVRSWRELAGRSFEFLDQPVIGFRDCDPFPVGPTMRGSLAIGEIVSPARGLVLAFTAGGDALEATTTLIVDFDETDAPYEPLTLTLLAPVRLGGLRVLGDLGSPTGLGSTTPLRIAGEVVDVADYRVEEVDGVVTLLPRATFR
jgi:hypothetical protein